VELLEELRRVPSPVLFYLEMSAADGAAAGAAVGAATGGARGLRNRAGRRF
jgi:hypothetical protein